MVQSLDTPSLFLIFLSLAVVFINAWTDAPSSTVSCLLGGALRKWQASLLCGIFNFLGAFLSSLIFSQVSSTVLSFSSFSTENEAKIGVLATFFTTIVFSVVCSFFGMPSSESHALLCALIGASFYFGGGKEQIFSLVKVFIFTILSSAMAFVISFLIARAFKGVKGEFRRSLVLSCSLSSLMHGVQDGQKLVAIILILCGFSATPPSFLTKSLIVFLVSLVLFVGSVLCSSKITASLSRSASLSKKSALISDIGSIITLLFCSVFGFAVSTGNVKTLSLVGASVAEEGKVNKKVTGEILITSLVTFPICILLSLLFCLAFEKLPYFSLWIT